MSVIDELEKITNDMRNGKVTESQVNKFRMLTVQQMIIDQNVKCGDDLLKLDKANLVSIVDAIGTLLFYPQWEPQTKNVEAECDTSS
jgi:hypothetical protein